MLDLSKYVAGMPIDINGTSIGLYRKDEIGVSEDEFFKYISVNEAIDYVNNDENPRKWFHLQSGDVFLEDDAATRKELYDYICNAVPSYKVCLV